LVFQTFFVALLFVAAMLVLVLAGPPVDLKAFAAVPLAIAAFEIFLWVMVSVQFKLICCDDNRIHFKVYKH
jgi:hypothetical protein